MTARAELPTVEAAQAFAAYGRFEDFQALFGRIEDEGFPLGIEGRLRAMTVLARLEALGAAPTDPDKLAEYLLPVVSGWKHQQDSVRRVIDEWAHGAVARTGKTITPRADRAAATPRAAARRWRGRTAAARPLPPAS
jgi:hypothetical protein